MHFDDRLATVLRLRASGEVVARIQYRQLLDLLGTSPSEARSAAIEAAFVRLGELGKAIAPDRCAAMLREAGLRLRSPRLVAALAGGDPAVALAAVQRADLSDEQWLDLIPALPVTARGILRHRRDLGPRTDALLDRLGIHDRGLPAAEAKLDPAVSAGIGAIVRRIEAYRRARQDNDNGLPSDSPQLSGGERRARRSTVARAFDFTSDITGRIVWADPGVAPMVIGQQLFARSVAGGSLGTDQAQRRQPVRGMILSLDGSPQVAGSWQLDAAPEFDPQSGRFTGYAGRLRRVPASAVTAVAPQPEHPESDRMRQLLHELRTPINAIQGFAEIIQQQLFGPTPHEYRALAANIAADSARILGAFDELERLARLDSGAATLESGETDLAAIVTTTLEQLSHHTGPRGSGFTATVIDADLAVALDVQEVERMVWRLLATLAGAAQPGEMLTLDIGRDPAGVDLTVALPSALAQRAEHDLFTAAIGTIPQAISAGMFGVGFALRLTASEARAAGGSLTRLGNCLQLLLPGLTAAQADHSHNVREGSRAAVGPMP